MYAATEMSDEKKSVPIRPVPFLTVLFFPKAAISNIYQGRSSDLLPSFAAFPFYTEQWHKIAKGSMKLTASGNV